MTRHGALILLAGLAALAAQRKYEAKKEQLPGEPVVQPIAYSHKKHLSFGLKCSNCHTIPNDAGNDGMMATFPKEAVCMGCHQSVKTDSQEIQKLAAFAQKKQPVPWERVYRVPDIVWFSHAVHVKDAKLECRSCHGAVEQRDVLFKEVSTGMMACMECHARMKAPNGCDTCHASQ
jgi:hypothetical protein